MNLTREDIDELLTILNCAVWDAIVMMGRSHDMSEVNAYKKYWADIQRWIERLNQVQSGGKHDLED